MTRIPRLIWPINDDNVRKVKNAIVQRKIELSLCEIGIELVVPDDGTINVSRETSAIPDIPPIT